MRSVCPLGVLAFVAIVVPSLSAIGGEPVGIAFRDVTREAGLVAPLEGIMGHGGAWGDFDGDGRIDLFVGGFCDRPNAEYAPADGPVGCRLLRNLGDGRFERARQPAVELFGRTSGAVFADLNNSGRLELYVANNARAESKKADEPQRSAQSLRSKLYRNDAGTLVDISAASGACPDPLLSARNVAPLDYDGDGRLDLLVIEDKFTRRPRTTLLKNLGDLTFRDANGEAGLPDGVFGLGAAVADINGDRRPDLFIPHSNRMFLSQANGTYRESAELNETFAFEPRDGEDWPCGACFGDLNRDGLLDLVISIHGMQARNQVFLNRGLKNGVPRFENVTARVGLGDVVPVRCAHVEIQDFDNDGCMDIYVSAAWLDDDGTLTPLVYRNTGLADGLPRFAPPRPIGAAMVYFPAGPSGDYDGDGRLDLFLINWFTGNRCRLMKNESPARHWIDVRFDLASKPAGSPAVNRQGIGSVVRVYRAGQAGQPAALLGVREMNVGYGYASGQPAVCHFGLGQETRVDVDVALPNGQTLSVRNCEVDRVHTFDRLP
jgi:hypothetical protein